MAKLRSSVHSSFKSIYECRSEGREKQKVVSNLEGTLLKDTSSFPYFMLLAWDAPAGLARFTTLLLLWPLVCMLDTFVSKSAAIKLMVFVSCAGVKRSDIASTASAVLPKFYLQDVHPEAWRVVSSVGHRYLFTSKPRIMVEPFAKEYLGIEHVFGSELEIHISSNRATGFLKSPGVLVGRKKEAALHMQFGENLPDVGLGDRASDSLFLSACKEGYVMPPLTEKKPLSPSQLLKPLIFHDGRLVRKPTPQWALFILIWIPFGIMLACFRIFVGALFPIAVTSRVLTLLGIKLIVKGTPPASKRDGTANGVIFVSTHRTLMDPLFVSIALKRPVTTLVYSASRVSEIISPIPSMRLQRDKDKDANIIKELLKKGDLHICPEGTTCREPFLLRFSALFAELTNELVPVATDCHLSVFHCTTARGWKGLDSFYFCMNPNPCYKVTFLSKLPESFTCGGGKTSYEVANYVQQTLADALNFEATNFTRKDKYEALLGDAETTSTTKKA